ncbi:MAG: 2-deoxy-D-gluconate 3-dehydrogenase [Spirochaetae bacterium HGW-Spirochaetae-1]|jgi:2-deoxy-D-gluconate 3-dehydrogenase|nr:MAG: 2-deoxy-D-gluconate 3-dehydrogenase [Spirochaetae bacterium HGW-Spirochaetae-1]
MILDTFKLKGKTAIVTGTSRGLGQAIARGLSEAGANIVGVSNESSQETGLLIEKNGGRYLELQVDLRTTAGIPGIISEGLRAFGSLDILVNNAGIIRRNDALDFTEEDWDAVMDINLKSLFFLSQASARQFVIQGRGGKIINIASMLSYQGGVRVASYTSSKSGVMGLTRLLANEWAKHNIQVNAIAPGYMATENTAPLRADEKRSTEILDRIPAGRWGVPEDLQGAAVFLAGSASDYINGFTLAVDGGWLAR